MNKETSTASCERLFSVLYPKYHKKASITPFYIFYLSTSTSHTNIFLSTMFCLYICLHIYINQKKKIPVAYEALTLSVGKMGSSLSDQLDDHL